MTTAALSETAIVNMGGLLLEDQALTSLNDGTSPYARFCQREFGYVRDEMLRKHPWHFNRKMAILAPDETPPAFRWKYSYTLPDDYLRLHTIRTYQNGSKTEYEVFAGRKVYTNIPSSLPIVYGARITNAAEFDPLFARALGYRLGLMAAQLVTGKAGYVDKANGFYSEAMYDAVHTNALEMGSDHYVDHGYGGAPTSTLDARGASYIR